MATSASTEIDDFTKEFEKEFSLFSCVSDSSIVVYEGQWTIQSHDGDKLSVPQYFRDRFRLQRV